MRIYKDRKFGLPQHVDEPRSHHHATSVDGPLRFSLRELPNGGDSSRLNGNVTRIPRGTGAIDDVAVTDYQVVRLSKCWKHEEEKGEVLH